MATRKTINTFSRGMDKDNHPSFVGEGYYIDARGQVLSSQEGDVFVGNNENGNGAITSISSTNPNPGGPGNYQVIGKVNLDQYIVFFSVKDDGTKSEIGVFDSETNTYETYVNNGGGLTYINSIPNAVQVEYADPTSLNFSLDHPIDAEARTIFNNGRTVYWTDDFNDPRALNLDNLIPDQEIAAISNLFIEQDIPVPVFNRTLEEGNIEVGVVQVIGRYLNENLDPLYFGIPSVPISVVENNRSEGRNKYDGAPRGKNASKSLVFDFLNLDDNFSFLEIIVITYVGDGDDIRAVIYQRKPVEGDSLQFVYSDKDVFIEEISLEEIALSAPLYNKAKCIEQKDNRLLLSNLSSLPVSIYQFIANKIKLKYQIRDMEYVDVVEQPLPPGGIGDIELLEVQVDSLNVNQLRFIFNKTVADSSLSINNFVVVEHAYIAASNFQETIFYPSVLVKEGGNTVVADFALDFTTINLSDFSDLITNPIYTYAIGTDIGAPPFIWVGLGGAPADIFEEGLGSFTTEVGEIIDFGRVCDITTPPLNANLVAALPSVLDDNEIIGLYGVSYLGTRDIIDNGGAPLVYGLDAPDAGAEALVGFQGSTSPDILILNIEEGTPNTESLNNQFFFGDFAGEENASRRTYLREENYSFSKLLHFKNSAKSPAFPIPGNDRDSLVDVPATVEDGGETGYLGTYVSTEQYPSSGGYPTNAGVGDDFSNDSRIRHHKMPTQSQQRIIKQEGEVYFLRLIEVCPVWAADFENVANGTLNDFDSTSDIPIGTKVLLNGLYPRVIINKAGNFTYTVDSPIPVNITDAVWERTINDLLIEFLPIYEEVQAFSFMREQRNVTQNRSIFAQGIAQNLVYHQGRPGGDDETEGPYLSNSYFFGKFTIEPGSRVVPRHDPNALFGFPNDLVRSLASFYSPDTILLKREIPTGTVIKPISVVTGRIFEIVKITGNGTVEPIRYGDALHLFGNYNTYDPLVVQPQNTVVDVRNLLGDLETIGDIGVDLPNYPLLPKVVNYINEGYTLIDIGEGNVLPDTANNEISILISYSKVNNQKFNETFNVTYNLPDQSTQRYLYNIFSNNSSQYGGVDSSEYIYAHTEFDLSNSGYFCFGNGDIFISKFSCKNSNNWRWGLEISANNNVQMHAERLRTSSNEEGEEYRALMYFFVESEVNCNYRHQPIEVDPITQEETEFGVPYYPNNPIITEIEDIQNPSLLIDGSGVLDIQPTLGESNGYNTLYSKENEVDKQFSLPIGFVEVTEFPHLTIYSEQSLIGEQSDQYRFFLPNNVHEIPGNTGEIWDTFVLSDTFFIHTKRSLWRTYFNEQTAISTTSGDVFLGSGGLFPLPSKEIFTTEGGYAGTQSQWAGTNTPFGRYFIDYEQRKIFLLTIGEGLKEVSGKLTRWLETNIPFLLGNDDNPFNPDSTGYLSVYDYDRGRLLVTKYERDVPWTLSFNPRIGNRDGSTGNYVSFHDYYPNVYASEGNRHFSIVNDISVGANNLWEHNIGDFGNFYGAIFPYIITHVVNADPFLDKYFQSIRLRTYSLDEINNVYQHIDTFKTFRSYNDARNSDFVNLVVSIPQLSTDTLKRSKDQFQAHYGFDQVLDHNVNIFDPLNLATNLPPGDPQKLFRPRLSGKYIINDFSYDNLNNNKFILINIESLYRIYQQ